MCPADDAVCQPALFLQTLHRRAHGSPGNLSILTENLAHLEYRNLALVPHDFHDLALTFRKRRQFGVRHFRLLAARVNLSTSAVIMATSVAMSRGHGSCEK